MNKKIKTWLPVFSGFYETIWDGESDEEMELENINEQRKEKNLPPVKWEDVEWDYEGYQQLVCKGITLCVEDELQKMGMVTRITFEKLSNPREYNFINDSIHCEIELSDENREKIRAYLTENKNAFIAYLTENYTDRSGFYSSYSPYISAWFDALHHVHKLGAVLNFILLNEDADLERDIHEKLIGNGVTLQAKNWEELTK